MLDSATALGRPNDATVRSAASRLGRHTSARGFDSVAGGLFDSGRPLGEPTNRDKIWWAQFEALPGLFRTYELTREDAHLRTLVKTLEWLERSPARDTRPGQGEWYWGVRDGRPVREAGQSYTVKGEEWKATYHNVRALLLLEDWLTQALH
jgi:mannose/cellobiose epimerase-like protein (N-acyl-D-glucosamine 2-epimerase family)